jgi:hypothetical protein
MRFYEPIQNMIASNLVWITLDEGIEISEMQYQSPLLAEARRMVIVPQKIINRSKTAGKNINAF